MFFKLLKLEFKSTFRSPQLAASLISKIMMTFLMIYLAMIFLGGSFLLYYGAIEEGEDPLKLFCRYFIIYWAIDLLLKYTMQQMPTENIKPLLTQNISKNTIVKFTLFKIALSFLTWGYLLFIIPFTILLATDEDYSTMGIISLSVTTSILVFINAFANIIINKKDLFLYSIFSVILLTGVAHYFNFIDAFNFSEKVLLALYQKPYWVVIPLFIFIFFAFSIFRFIKRNFYLDQGLELKKTVGKTENINFLNRYGKIGVFINNDIRLIKRSKMAKSTVLGSVFFLFYGLLFYTAGYSTSFMQVFLGLFVTGGFMFTFGQRVPAWDSSYYPLMMTQNIPYQEYIKAKWSLTAFSIVISIFLALGYAFISWELYFTIFAAGLYNLGFNSYITLLSGAYNKKAIDLNSTKKAFTGTQNNFNWKLMLMLLPQLALPMLVFGLMKFFFGMTPAVISLGILGLIGFLLRNKIFGWIVKAYKTEKYSTLIAFKED